MPSTRVKSTQYLAWQKREKLGEATQLASRSAVEPLNTESTCLANTRALLAFRYWWGTSAPSEVSNVAYQKVAVSPCHDRALLACSATFFVQRQLPPPRFLFCCFGCVLSLAFDVSHSFSFRVAPNRSQNRTRRCVSL